MSSESSSASRYAKHASLAAIARIAPLAVQLVATPFIIASLGVDAFAIWAILSTTIGLMLTADLGVVGLMQRYHSVARANQDSRLAGRITATVLLFLLTLLAIVTLLGPWIADALVKVINVGPGLTESAWLVFRFAGTLSVMQLIALAMTAYLSAHNRFLEAAVASLIARGTFVIALTIVVVRNIGLEGLVVASFIDGTVAILVTGGICWRHLALEMRGFVNKHELAQLWAYSWRNQLSALGFVVQRESDVVMAAIMLPAAFQATIASTAQLAAAIAFAPTILLVPLFTSLSALSTSSPAQASVKAHAAESTWFRLLLPFTATALAVAPFAAVAWLGPELPALLPIMAIITAGFLIALANSVRAIYIRALGKPGIESASYFWLLVTKLAIGIPATLIWGIYGLALSTVIASVMSVIVLWKLTSKSEISFPDLHIKKLTIIYAITIFLVGLAASLTIWLFVADRFLQLFCYCILVALIAGLYLRKSLPLREAEL